MKTKLALLVTGLLAALPAQAIIYSTNWTTGFANGGVIPDDDYSGWTDQRSLSAFPAGTVNSVAVTMNLSGGWNGDLYAYLVNNTGGLRRLLFSTRVLCAEQTTTENQRCRPKGITPYILRSVV
jgi:hypothetical protein